MTATTTEEAFLEAIRANPDDDTVRLVYADWLRENGHVERADFIEVQCALAKWRANKSGGVDGSLSSAGITLHAALRKRETELFQVTYTYDLPGPCVPSIDGHIGRPGPHVWFNRGFPAEVHCTLAEWCGGECGRCDGADRTANRPNLYRCRECGAWGRNPGIGPAVVAAHPVERVVLTDRLAYPTRPDDKVAWFPPDVPGGYEAHTHRLPEDLFLRLEGFDSRGAAESQVRWYNSRSNADAALSLAALSWARAQV